MRTTTIIICAAVLCATPGWVAAQADAGAKKAPFADIDFKGRVKFPQTFERVFKISVEPEVMPLDSETMTAVMNGTAVAGAAARDVFGLGMDEYSPHVHIKASTSAKPGAVMARVEMTFRADGRIPLPAVDALAESLRDHLQVVLSESINIDRRNLEKRQDNLLARQTYLEKKYVEVWQNRIRIAEDAGLAEYSVGLKRGNVGDLEANLNDVELELELRHSRLRATQEEIDARQSSSAPPQKDPLADELEKLVRIRARQLDASESGTPDERDAAEARMLEAKLRWIERVQELEELLPEKRLETLETEIKELEIRKGFYQKSLAAEIDRVRSLFRYDEHVKLLAKKEDRLDKAIDRIEEQVDELATYSEKLGTITVTIIGQSK